MTIALEAFGAARHVTGTEHLIDVGGTRVVLDCVEVR